jgi:hypothetical protein
MRRNRGRHNNYSVKGRKGMRTEADRKRARYAEKEKAAGRPLRVPADKARTHRDALRAAGMTDSAIAAAATENGYPIHQTTVSTAGLHSPNVHRDTEAAIMSVDLETAPAQPHKLIPILGTQRALEGLVAAGYSLRWLSTNIVYEPHGRKTDNRSIAYALMSGKFNRVELQTFRRIWTNAQKLESVNPLDMGLTSQAVSRARNYAAKRGYVPLHCWDEDTIMDPGAFPEWTGECGTVTGYNLHRRHGIHVRTYVDKNGQERSNVLCEACCKARTSAKDEAQRTLMRRRDECAGMILDGVPYRVIAAELGMSTRTVQRVARELEEERAKGGPDQGSEIDDS